MIPIEEIQEKAELYWEHNIDVDPVQGYIAGYTQALEDIQEQRNKKTQVLKETEDHIDKVLESTMFDQWCKEHPEYVQEEEDKRNPEVSC